MGDASRVDREFVNDDIVPSSLCPDNRWMNASAIQSNSPPGSASTPTERALRLLAKPAIDEDGFYAIVAEAIAVGLNARTAAVVLRGRDDDSMAVQALWDRGRPAPAISLRLSDGPCFELYSSPTGSTKSCFLEEISSRFPNFSLLAGRSDCSYRGQTFSKADGTPVGHILAIGEETDFDPTTTETLFALIRDRIETEYRRWRADAQGRNYDQIVNQSSDYVAIVDLAYGFRAVNPAYLDAFGWEAGGVLPRSVPELHGARSFESSIKTILDRCFEGEKLRTQGWFDMPTRKRQFLDVAAVPYRSESEEITGAIVYMRNVTARQVAQQERRGLEARLEEDRKAESLRLMAGGIAHDFNNLLVGMLGGADLLLTETLSEDGQRTARTVKQSALLASDLCRKMLSYTGQAAYEPELTDLTQLVRQTVTTFAGALPERVSVEFDLKAELPVAQVDPQEISQVILNLIVNAAEAYEASGGVVHVATGSTRIDHSFLDRIQVAGEVPTGEYIFCQVRDMGCGVDPDTRSRIFDPFFSTKPTGRGLGLAATRGILRAHGGCVQFESQPGAGTTVRIFFPVDESGLELQPPEPVADSAGCVLVIDDEPMVCEIVSKMLDRAGFTTMMATSAAEGTTLFSARSREVDIILLDVSIPGTSCQELTARLLTLDPTARIVLCSGSSARDPQLKSILPKSYGFLSKPFSSDALIQKVEDTVSRRAG